MNERIKEIWKDVVEEEWLYKDWEQIDQEILFENLGINL